MGAFIVGILIGICLGIAGRDLWQHVEFLWFLGAERRRKRDIEKGIKKLNKHINKDK